MSLSSFHLDAAGYVRHWLVTEVNTAPYVDASGSIARTATVASDNELRARVIDPAMVPPEGDIALGLAGPYGQAWRFYDPGANIFVEQSGFWYTLSVLDFYAATDVISPVEGDVCACFWACGCGDLWVNGTHIARNPCTRYMYPDPLPITAPLREGVNRIQVRVRALGVRDSRVLFGLQLAEPNGFRIVLPGTGSPTADFAHVTAWLDTLRVANPTTLQADGPPPVAVTVAAGDHIIAWDDAATCAIPPVENLTVKTSVAGQALSRKLEIPANRTISTGGVARDLIQGIADTRGTGRNAIMNVLARHTLGLRGADDTAILEETCERVDARLDCADFQLAALLRMMHGTSLTAYERERITRTALGFRYWDDEPGVDALCFRSENHSLLFHGCQMMAGALFPEAVFTNSGRTGRAQAEMGRQGCRDWMCEKTATGLLEFLSSTYLPITVAALLNVVDFADDADLSASAVALVDRIFTVLAEHAFHGVTVGPQGRVYRNVLHPDSSGTQALLAYATPTAVVATSDWLSFLAASTYQPPTHLTERMDAAISKTYPEAAVEIHLEKTGEYLLTSLEIPALFPIFNKHRLIPGQPGYQQHVWHATLGRDCHVFVNHPGASFDLSSARPGFWYGNGTLPRQHQLGGALCQIFAIDPQHPIPFTHAHWPTEVFDEQRVDGHWACGRKGNGYIALWCSQPLTRHTEVLTDRELRAEGRRVAWLAICGRTADYPTLAAFATACRDTNPQFDAEKLMLTSRLGTLEYG